MKVALSAMALAGAIVQGEVFLHEDFSGNSFEENWVSPNDSGLGKFTLSSGNKYSADAENFGLQTSQDAKFYMAARNFEHDFDNTDKPMVIQLSVKHEQSIDCGGGYVKVYAPGADLATLDGDSPYNVMFGPDICGSKKIVHVIFGKKGDNHLITKKISCKADIHTHAYTLIIKPDNTYSVLIDNEEKESGTIADDWEILEPRMINDPEQSKPDDWVDNAMMDDVEDVKPDNWDDEPEYIVDPDAEQPEDWDTEEDGEWTPTEVPNEAWKGPFRPKRIDNPAYIGAWEHPMIENPDFEDDPTLYQFNSGAIGFDVWQVKSGSIFDDVLVTDDVEYAKEVAAKSIVAAEKERELKMIDDDAAKAKAEAQDDDDDFIEEDDDVNDEL